MALDSNYWQLIEINNLSQPMKTQLDIGQGNTQLQPVQFQDQTFYIKREDLNPSGSVKDRGLAFQISTLVSQGITKFVISSSGNAAISASMLCKKAGVDLTVFVSPHIDQQKLNTLKQFSTQIIQDNRPISSAFRYAKQHNYYNLRPSVDPLGTVGYQTLSLELADQLPQNLAAIFFPVSSGTTLVGAYEGFQKINQPLPQFHCVQTSAYHPIASQYDTDFIREDLNLTSGLVAKNIPLKPMVQQVIAKTKGSGWVVNNHSIKEVYQWLHLQNINTYYEGAAAIAGFLKARSAGWQFPAGEVVCIITGTDRQ